jgi:hypothetical protein
LLQFGHLSAEFFGQLSFSKRSSRMLTQMQFMLIRQWQVRYDLCWMERIDHTDLLRNGWHRGSRNSFGRTEPYCAGPSLRCDIQVCGHVRFLGSFGLHQSAHT